MQTPSPAKMVMVVGRPAQSNGADAAPAVITRVWNEREDGSWLVNLHVFPDAQPSYPATSIPLYATEQDAQAQLPATAAYWPARV